MSNNFELKKMKNIVKQINALRDKYMKMSDEELKAQTPILKEKYAKGKTKEILPDAFALVREASRRAINKEHYDVQLLGGIALYNGKIAEAKTGEGKTITIYLPAYLESLAGKGVHVVTVNDYLAKRDATEAAEVFKRLGVSVGCVLSNGETFDKQIAYKCDITYVTNTELGFDYLRDHIAILPENVVLRPFHYAIIDEVDSVLIDEAKTPLIISGPGEADNGLLQMADIFVKTLKEGKLNESTKLQKLMGENNSETGDFIKDEKEKQIYLTEVGIARMEEFFHVTTDDYGTLKYLGLQRAINNSLRAHYLMKRNHDYIVRDEKIELVSQERGRIAVGHRFTNGLHQAIEMKEGVPVQRENRTIASITFQSFFNKYPKKAGLTGTAMTSAKEFKEIYKLDVIEIPTNKPVIREDKPDLVFMTMEDKWRAVIQEAHDTHKTGQPLLIGTSSVSDSEIVSSLLTQVNIPHNTLNAKNEELEAGIIAEAGKFGAVTVATNMAGRGTDIILDDEARAAGGLKVIGTQRHDSRRIDNQLKGRSGRQGDPGSSQFFISLEDDMMRIFADSASLTALMSIATEGGEAINSKALTKVVEKAQESVETANRLAREGLVKYDEVNNEHREYIYAQREEILNAENPRELLQEMFFNVVDDLIDKYIKDDDDSSEWNVDGLFTEFFNKFVFVNINLDTNGMKKIHLKESLYQLCEMLIDMKEKQIGEPAFVQSVERACILKFLDMNWSRFLSSMEYVKRNIGGQAYGQRDPVMEYKKKGFELLNKVIEDTQLAAVKNFLTCAVKVEKPPVPADVKEPIEAK